MDNIKYAPKFKIGDSVKVYVDWIGYQTGKIIGMNDKSIVYDWLYDIKIDGDQETTREYIYIYKTLVSSGESEEFAKACAYGGEDSRNVFIFQKRMF